MRIASARKDAFALWRRDVDRMDSELLHDITAGSPYIGSLPTRTYRKTLKSGRRPDPSVLSQLDAITNRLAGLAKVKERIPKTTLKKWMSDLAAAREAT
jgi:hypothetical protein